MKHIEDMVAEAAAKVYGAEWGRMTGKQQKDIIMGFIAEAARRAREEEQ